jgi:hypothetical protein
VAPPDVSDSPPCGTAARVPLADRRGSSPGGSAARKPAAASRYPVRHRPGAPGRRGRPPPAPQGAQTALSGLDRRRGGVPVPGDPGRSVRSRITALTPLPGHRPETLAGRDQALVPLNTNNRYAGIKSRNVVIADEAARKSRHRVVRPTRKAVCCRIGQSTTVRYLNANRRCARDAKRKLFDPKATES